LRSMPPMSAGQPPPSPPPRAAEPARAEAAKGADPATGEKAFAGRVLDPDGKPVAGAKLYALYYTPKVMPVPERATSDKDGGFRFTVPKKEFDRSASATPWDEVMVVAVAEGYGLGFPDFRTDRPPAHTDLTLRLVKDDAPITARLRNLEGKPVAGATAVVRELWWPADGGDLKEFAAAVKRNGELHSALTEHRLWQTGTWMGRDIGRVLPPAVTDAEGRFVLKGVGRERVVQLAIEGPTMATTELWAMTRPGETIRVAAQRRSQPGEVTFAGAAFERVVPPGRPVVGTVRDKDTGKPIPGALVESYLFGGVNVIRTHLRTVADKDGRYRLLGLPKGAASQIRVGPPDGEPYLMTLARVSDAPGLEPVTVDVKLKRGVWITGKVTDKATGRPVPSWIRYAVHGDNPNLPDAPGLTFNTDMRTRPEDGTFRFVGLPGRGVVAAQAHQPGRYRTGAGADRIKDLDRFLIPAGGGRGLFSPEYSHAIVEVNPEKGAESATCELVLVSGVTRTLTVVGPDAKPLAGALVRGLEHPDVWDDRPAASAEFTVRDLKPGESRLIQVSHPEKKLAGSLVVRGDEKEPLVLKLEAAGVLTGRFVTTDGKPLAGLELFAQIREPVASPGPPAKADVTLGSFPRGPRTDKDGKFRLEGLAPGLKYRFGVFRGMFALTPEGDLAKGVTVKAGETKDLGDIPIRLPEK
ncbi:MAG: hypothetical protein J2P46_06850, partial [Zavarzinella sp.]|nr:hypothetical protein [Zavarzinella sp.]